MTQKAVILSSVRWDYMWQRHQAVATALTEIGFAVRFVEPHPRGIAHILSWALRRARSKFSDTTKDAVHHPRGVVNVVPWFDRMTTRAVDDADLLIVYLPSTRNHRLVNRFNGEQLVYDDVLDWEAVPRAWFPPRNWRSVVRAIARQARQGTCDVWTDSPHVVRTWDDHGVNAKLLLPSPDEEFRNHSWSSLEDKTPVLGYFGSVDHTKVDVHYLAALSEEHQVHVIGELDSLAYRVLGESKAQIQPTMRLSDLVDEIDGWTDIILPYVKNDRTKSLVPAKLLNALVTGRRVHVRNLHIPESLETYTNPLPSDPREFRVSQGQTVAAATANGWADALAEVLSGEGT